MILPAPLRPVPLVELSHGVPSGAPVVGWPSGAREGITRTLQDDLAWLVPNARHATATESEHGIHQDHPELVIAAIHEVVETLRNRRPVRQPPAP